MAPSMPSKRYGKRAGWIEVYHETAGWRRHKAKRNEDVERCINGNPGGKHGHAVFLRVSEGKLSESTETTTAIQGP